MKTSYTTRDLEKIFRAGVAKVDPFELICETLSVSGNILKIDTTNETKEVDLANIEQIFVIGFGKASARMALALESILDDRISEGIILIKYGHNEILKSIKTIEAGHPLPDENGLLGTRKIVEMIRRADEKTLVISLISGGGSALLTSPYKHNSGSGEIELTLKDLQDVTQVLLNCGAAITEINCVRKHLSSVKGGRLTEMIAPATSINLILSDVVGDHLDIIASGPTSPDNSTYEDMQFILEKYKVTNHMPENVIEVLKLGLKGEIKETPDTHQSVFKNSHNFLIGTNSMALEASLLMAQSLGYETTILTTELTGDAREVAKELWSVAKQQRMRKALKNKPICLLCGGESTVQIRGMGKGGRNQEMALAILLEMASDERSAKDICFLSAGTDGNDGPTDAAGAFATLDLLLAARRKGVGINEHLNNNDSYHFFASIDGLFKTGPTNTNVCDIQAIIIS
ncbi:MAG: glycerate kinase [Proteobacteria bacterium]|nr:glycerate kinase [Pseudomonadota bacterium]